MTEQNIALIGFGKLEPSEMNVINQILETHVKKLQELTNYESLRLKLHPHQHSKSFIHEIHAELQAKQAKGSDKGREIIISASATQKSLFSALSEVLEKLASEAVHKMRTTKETGKEMMRDQRKNGSGKQDFSEV